MKAGRTKTPFRALIEGLVGLILFLVALVLIRYVADHTAWPVLDGFAGVLLANAPLIVIFPVLFTIGEVLAAFPFPLNLAFPVFDAVGSMLLVSLILKIIAFLDRFYALGTGSALDITGFILLPLTLLVTLVAGYMSIFAPSGRPATTAGDRNDSPGGEREGEGSPSWDEIGEGFRKVIDDAVRKIRDEIRQGLT
ncbi:MAG: hypothetical protein QHH04_06980 [Methanolinea sp.]|nr:hypothetical protein [Methanolinea sp.]